MDHQHAAPFGDGRNTSRITQAEPGCAAHVGSSAQQSWPGRQQQAAAVRRFSCGGPEQDHRGGSEDVRIFFESLFEPTGEGSPLTSASPELSQLHPMTYNLHCLNPELAGLRRP